jgi:hypothetical protein
MSLRNMQQRQHSILLLAAAAIVLLIWFPARASASPVTFSFTGVLEFQISGTPTADYPVNAPVSGFFTFESTTSPYSANAFTADYAALTDASLTIGTSTYTSFQNHFISATNNFGGGLFDQYVVSWDLSGEPALASGNAPFQFQLYVEDFGTPPDLLTSTALPATPPLFSLASFVPYLSLVTDGPAGTNDYRGELTSLTLQDSAAAPVPEPATLILLGGGLASVAVRLRKRRSDL